MLRRKSPTRRAIVTPDKHFPYHDVAAINVLCKAIEMIKPDIYIDIGDVGEWEAFSHWKYKRRKAPPLEYMIPDFNKDVEFVNRGMDIIDEALDKANCKEKHITEGNHDNWLNMCVERYPYLEKHEYNFKDAVSLKARGYKYHPFGEHMKIGKLYFYHGHQYGGQYHTANHLRKLGCNIMYGHWHDLQHMTATHMDGPKAAWSIGCLKDMSPSANLWLGNRSVNWAHAFAVVDFWGTNGEFTVHIVQIIDGKCSLNGELLNGNK